MLPPNELKHKGFAKVVRGYSTAEVDEYIAFIIDKYTELYRENDELERKLRTTLAKLEAIKKDEESIRSALVNAQRASSAIINEANERAEAVTRAAKVNCNKILTDFRDDIRAERDKLIKLREVSEKFKAELFYAYNTHIEYIENISAEIEGLKDINITDEAFVRRAVNDIKRDVTGNIEKNADLTGTVSGAPRRPEQNPAAQTENRATTAVNKPQPAAQLTAQTKPAGETRITQGPKGPETERFKNTTPAKENKTPDTDYAAEDDLPADNTPVDDINPDEDFSDVAGIFKDEPENNSNIKEGLKTEPEAETELGTDAAGAEIDEYGDGGYTETEKARPEKSTGDPKKAVDSAALAHGQNQVKTVFAQAVPEVKKSSVKDTIRQLNMLLEAQEEDGRQYKEKGSGKKLQEKAAEEAEDDDSFGREEFSGFTPEPGLGVARTEIIGGGDESAEITEKTEKTEKAEKTGETEKEGLAEKSRAGEEAAEEIAPKKLFENKEDKEYLEFIKSIEEASGSKRELFNRKNRAKNKKSGSGNDYDFI